MKQWWSHFKAEGGEVQGRKWKRRPLARHTGTCPSLLAWGQSTERIVGSYYFAPDSWLLPQAKARSWTSWQKSKLGAQSQTQRPKEWEWYGGLLPTVAVPHCSHPDVAQALNPQTVKVKTAGNLMQLLGYQIGKQAGDSGVWETCLPLSLLPSYQFPKEQEVSLCTRQKE